MSTINKYIFLIPLLLALSCKEQYNNGNRSYIKEGLTLDTIHAKLTKIDEELLFPIKSVIVEDKLVIYNRTEKNMFKVFQLPELNYLYSFGEIGKGPNEFGYISDSGIKEYQGKLIIIDGIKYNKFKIHSDSISKISTFNLKTDTGPINNFQLISDSLYINDNNLCDSGKEYSLINLNKRKLISEFGDFPTFSDNIKKCEDIKLSSLKINTSRQSDGRIAALYLYLNRIKIFDNKGYRINDIIIGEESILDSSPSEGSMLHRISVCSDENHFYTLYAGISEQEAIEYGFKTKFEIWNWDGKLLKTYVLSNPILSFAVSDDFKKIYATSFDSFEHIYEFTLPKIL